MAAPFLVKKSVLTQGNVGATDVELTITNDGSRVAWIDSLVLGRDNQAAGRTWTAERRSGSVITGLLLPAAGVALDNQFLPLLPPKPPAAAAPAADDLLPVVARFPLYPGERVYLKGAALAQNETGTVWLRVEGSDITIANASGAGVTLATTDA